MADRKPKTNGDSAAKDVASIGLIQSILGSHGRAIPNIVANDTWPNIDGLVNINNDTKVLLGSIDLQVKTLPKNYNDKFSCPVDLFVYVKETGNPVMLLMADNTNDKVYWEYFDEDRVSRIDYKTDQKTKSIDISEDRCFSKQDRGYIAEWEKIVTDRKAQAFKMKSAVTDLTDTEIGISKDLIEKHRYSEALDYIAELKTKRWDTASDNEKFRMLTNQASATQKLERPEEAAVLYHEAFALESNTSRAQTNEALALIIDGKLKDALKIVNDILAINPIDTKAATIAIHAMSEDKVDYDTIYGSFDEAVLKTSEVLHALASVMDGETRNDEVIKLLEEALSLDKDNIYIQSDLAIARLYKIQQSKGDKVSPELTAEQKVLAESAVELLKHVWSKINDPRDQKSKSNILFNLSVAYRMLNDECHTDNTINELLKLNPDNPTYLRHAVGNAVELGKFDVAEAYLINKAFSDIGTPELQLMLIDVLLAQGKTQQAFEFIEQFQKVHTEKDDLFLHANDNLFKALVDLGKLDDAQALAEKLSKDVESETLSTVFFAKLAQLQQKVDEAISLLTKAERLISNKTDRKTTYDIAEIAFEINAYDIAAKAYERILDPTSDNVVTRRYLASLYESKRYQSAIAVVETLKANGHSAKGVAQFEWVSYMALQNLAKARTALTEFIADNPDDEEARISVALIDFRTQDNRKLSAYLRRDIKLDKLDQQSLAQLAKLYQLKGNTMRTLEVAYEMRRRYPSDAEAHSAYITIMLGLGNKKHPLIDIEEVGPNSALLYDGGHFIVETTYEPDLSKNEISLADAERRGFIGKRKGEEIVLSTNHLSGDRSVKLTNVQSKYVFALQDSMLNYERVFTDQTDLMSFNTGVENNNFDPLFKQLDESYENATNAENLYKSGKLTIDLFAKTVGKNIIEVFYALRLSPQLGVHSTRGDDAESQASYAALSQKVAPKLVADITALITLYELDLSVADLGVGKILITQSTQDLIVSELGIVTTESKQEGATLFKHGDQYVRQEVTTKERQARIKNIQDLLKWIDDNAQIEPFTDDQLSSDAYNKSAYGEIESILLESQIDTMKLSIGEGRILYSDDIGLKGLAEEIFSVGSTSTSIMLTYLHNSGHLDSTRFVHAIIELASANYYHVGISPVVIFEAANKSQWKPDEPVMSVLRALCRPEVNDISMSVVIMQFLELSNQQGRVEDLKKLFPTIISEAIKHHDRNEILKQIRAGIGLAFKDSLQLQRSFIEILGKWIEENS